MSKFPVVTFAKPFDYHVSRVATVAYPAGFTGKIPRDHFAAAVAAGVLETDHAPEADRLGAPPAEEVEGPEDAAGGGEAGSSPGPGEGGETD